MNDNYYVDFNGEGIRQRQSLGALLNHPNRQAQIHIFED